MYGERERIWIIYVFSSVLDTVFCNCSFFLETRGSAWNIHFSSGPAVVSIFYNCFVLRTLPQISSDSFLKKKTSLKRFDMEIVWKFSFVYNYHGTIVLLLEGMEILFWSYTVRIPRGSWKKCFSVSSGQLFTQFQKRSCEPRRR